MNKKGFALTETLVVVVFLVSIFTFIYISIVPLIGKYENAIDREKDIDIVYKLYQIRRLIMSDSNRSNMTSGSVNRITCAGGSGRVKFSNTNFCKNLMEQMELSTTSSDNYVLLYVNAPITDAIADSIKSLSEEIWEYATKYQKQIVGSTLFLLDTSKHTIAHLDYDLPILCKRVTSANSLHKETCTNSNADGFCQAGGYALNSTITYGKAKAQSKKLETGDAFDCDVNGNGIVDKDANGNSIERFYYVSDYYDTSTKTFSSTTAVLIYYSGVINGTASTSGASYATQADAQSIGTCERVNGCNVYGPITAIKELPTTAQWNNVDLKTTTRAILAEYNNKHGVSTVTDGTLPSNFSYAGKAARFITAQEIMRGCGITSFTNDSVGILDGCNFLFEGTKYADASKASYGTWTESTATGVGVDAARAENRSLYSYTAKYINSARPAIDVPYSRLSY